MLRAHGSDQSLHSLLALVAALEDLGTKYVLIGRRSRTWATLAGDGDLDLLVGRLDGATAKRILLAHGFGQRAPHPWFRNHAVIDYIGRDGPTGRPTHVQLHHELRLGRSVTRTFRLPVTAYLTSTSVLEPPVRVPHPAAHLLLHSMKALLGMRRIGRSADGPFDSDELRLLLPLTSREEVLETGRQMFPPLGDEMLEGLYGMVLGSAQDAPNRIHRARVAAFSRLLRRGLAEWAESPVTVIWARSLYRRGLRRLGYQPQLDPGPVRAEPTRRR